MGFTLSHFISQIHPRDLFRLLAIGMCHFLPVHHFVMACLLGPKVKIQHRKEIFLFLFCKRRKILRKPDDLGSLDIFIHVVRVVFAALGTCLSSSAGFPIVSIFLAFKASKRWWDVLLNPLETITDLHFLKNMGLIESQDICIGFDFLFALSDGNSSVCHSLFSHAY